ncbi:MAG: DnaA/Hda family protein [Planctomycetota bacterium]
MNTLATEPLTSEPTLRQIGLLQPSLRKGSYGFMIGPNPLLPGFVCGPENASVWECCHPDALRLLDVRSPLLLCGASGTGKTSLALTVATLWLNQDSQRRLTFSNAIEFSRSLVRAIKADDMPRFRQVYRDCDCLVIDNIHELVGKPSAQEECIATLDHLASQNKVVIATAPDLPVLLAGLDVALISRLAAGHSVVCRHPGPEARRRILQQLAVEIDPSLYGEELDRFSSQLSESQTVIQLRGQLLRWSHQLRSESSSASGHRIAGRLFDPVAAPAISLNEIAKAVAKDLKVPVETLIGPLRKSAVVRARGLAMLLMRQLTSDSYESIGNYFSGRDHTTVMHACKKTETDLKHDPELARIQERIRQRFQRG